MEACVGWIVIKIQNEMADLISDGTRSVCEITWLKVTQQQLGETEIKRKGSKYPLQGGKTACYVYGQISRRCGKCNHFEIVCLKPRERVETRAVSMKTKFLTTNQVTKMQNIRSRWIPSNPWKINHCLKVKAQGTPVTIMANSEAIINVLDRRRINKLEKTEM